MPERKTNSAVFAGCALAALGAWATLIVGVATLSSEQSVSDRTNTATGGANGGIAGSYQGLSGPLADHLKRRLGQHPTFTHLRLSQSTGRGLFAGRGAPNKRVILLKGQRSLADTQTNANGEWQISTAITEISGTHAFSLEQRMDEGRYIAGESIRLHVPGDYRETVDVTSQGASAGFQLVAVRTDGDDIGSAASRKFDELFSAGRLDGNDHNTSGDGSTGNSDKKYRQYAQRDGDILAPAWNWLEDANRSYHGEIVPRIKRGGGSQSIAVNSDREEQERVVTTVRRSRDEGGSGWPTIGSWAPPGISDWLTAARRGYSTEIVPRLSGKVPSIVIARRSDDDEDSETEAQRRSRLERERNATDVAERERLDAERRRRAEEQRRIADQQAAERAEAQRRRDEEEEARKIAEERRRVLERRAEQQRLAALSERQRQAELEAERRRAREAEITRAQEDAEKAALERQRRAELANQERSEDEARRRKAEEFEQERQRLAQLRLKERESAREEIERRRIEQERRDRLTAQAEAIKRRRAEANLRAREGEQRRLERQREERRLTAEREREESRLEDRRQRLALATERAKREAENRVAARVPPPTKRPQRIARNSLRDLNRFRQRDTEIEFRSSDRNTQRSRGSDTTEKRPRRNTQTRRQGLNTFKVRETEIEFRSSDQATRTTASNRSRAALPSKRVKQVRKPRKVASRRTAELRRKAKARRRKSKVRGYRRQVAASKKSRCHRRAGRRIDPPGTYVVRKGDSLWRISKRHYRLGRYFKTIHRANSRKIRKARLIYPCQRFHLPNRR